MIVSERSHYWYRTCQFLVSSSIAVIDLTPVTVLIWHRVNTTSLPLTPIIRADLFMARKTRSTVYLPHQRRRGHRLHGYARA